MDLAGARLLRSALPRQGRSRGPEVALGTIAAYGEVDPNKGFAKFRDTLASGGHADGCTEIPRALTRQAER